MPVSKPRPEQRSGQAFSKRGPWRCPYGNTPATRLPGADVFIHGHVLAPRCGIRSRRARAIPLGGCA
eukprot:15276273-Alexandrium_andersonii.AAC.1